MLLSITGNYCDSFDRQLYIIYVNDEVNCVCTFDNIDRVLKHYIYLNQADVVNSFNEWNAECDNLMYDWVHNNVRVSKPRMR